MTLGPVRVMEAGVVLIPSVEEVCEFIYLHVMYVYVINH